MLIKQHIWRNISDKLDEDGYTDDSLRVKREKYVPRC